MSKAPAFQLYAADFDMDTGSWTAPQVGVYVRLLLSAWVNGGIPNNMAELARIARIDTRTLAKMWKQTLAKKWKLTTENMYVNSRMESEREKQEIYRESQRKKGEMRSKKMWEGHIAVAKKRLQPEDSSSSSSSTSIKEKKEKKVVLSDDQWLKTLEDNLIYEGLEVKVLYGKMLVWCENNRKKPTRRRFVNWLNREEKPMGGINDRSGNNRGPGTTYQKTGRNERPNSGLKEYKPEIIPDISDEQRKRNIETVKGIIEKM